MDEPKALTPAQIMAGDGKLPDDSKTEELLPPERIPGSRAHLFKKGQSGNPGGRPKTKVFTEAIKKYLAAHPEEADKIAKAILKKMKQGNVSAFKEVLDRVEGTVKSEVDLTVNVEQDVVERLKGARLRLAKLKGEST